MRNEDEEVGVDGGGKGKEEEDGVDEVDEVDAEDGLETTYSVRSSRTIILMSSTLIMEQVAESRGEARLREWVVQIG